MDQIVTSVYSTSDYSKFKRLEGNRDVIKSRANKICKSIDKVGWVRNPIIVNENYEVIDGQGRLEACKIKGIPVEYIVCDGLGQQECIAINEGQTNWKDVDYIQMHAEMGNQNYQYLMLLIEKHKAIVNKSTIVNVAFGVFGDHGATKVSSGNLSLSLDKYRVLDSTFEQMGTIKDYIKHIDGKGRAVETSVAWVLIHSKCDKKRFLEIVRMNCSMFMPVVNIVPFLRDISKYYNKGLKKSEKRIHLDVEYEEYKRGEK